MKNLLKIKSIVTILLVFTLVVMVIVSLFTDVNIKGEIMGLFGTAVGAAIGSLFAKPETPPTAEKEVDNEVV